MALKSKNVWIAVGAIAVAVAMLVFRGEREPDSVWHPWDGPTIQRDLEDISQDTMRVLALRDPLVWEERERTTTGLEYELLQRFARKAKLKMKVIPFDHPDSLLQALWRGDGDLGAMQATPHSVWKHHFSVSEAYASVRPLIATHRTEAFSGGTASATGDSVRIALASPFIGQRLKGINAEMEPVTEDGLFIDLVLNKQKAMVLSDLRAGYETDKFPNIEFSEALGDALPLGFVVRSTSPSLLEAINGWIADKHESEARSHIIDAYADDIPEPGPLYARRAKGMHRDSISPFDDEFRQHAAATGWDWRLLAAMAWKETRFDSTVTSRKGAMGIMQFMPGTAANLGLDSTSSMSDHIEAAARYLNKLDLIWLRAVPDKEQRLRFVLASYNAGPGHVIDAQRLADQLGLDPAKWDNNVENAVLLLTKPRFFLRPEMKNGYCKGSQVFHYVRGVLAVRDQIKAKR